MPQEHSNLGEQILFSLRKKKHPDNMNAVGMKGRQTPIYINIIHDSQNLYGNIFPLQKNKLD